MKNKNNKIFFYLIIPFFSLLSLFFISSHQVQAVSYNTRGWAWSENIGWISFNCENKIIGHDYGTCKTIDYPNGIDYGVHICENEEDLNCVTVAFPKKGKFIGYAWSENIGWINFGPLSGFPTDPQNQAKLNIRTTCLGPDEDVTGWAKVVNTGGWIKMSGSPQNELYKVKRDGKTKYLTGWVWSENFGWISFNGTNYKVQTFKPSYKPGVINLTSSQGKEWWCTNNKINPQINLSWTFDDCKTGDKQESYSVQIAESVNFITPVIDVVERQSATSLYSTSIEEGDKLQYGGITEEKTYYYHIQVKSDKGLLSEWSEIKSFTTPSHPYPQASLECSKDGVTYGDCKELSVSAGEKIWFKGNDIEPCGGLSSYDCGEVTPCSCSGITITGRTWGFGGLCPSELTCLAGENCINSICKKTGNPAENTTVREYSAGTFSKGPSLEIKDNVGYTCGYTEEPFLGNKVNFPLPIWKEVIPKN